MRPLVPDDPSHIGAYRLLGRLGAGGMGRVYLGRAPGGRIVAVKLVHAELARQTEFRERFAREVTAARRVGGEWTAAVLDADTDAEVPWVATGYVAGPSLESVVSEGYGPLPPASARALAHRLALALASIHDAGLVHRDLKPSNILLTVDGPRVIDFGIARALDTVTGGGLTRTGALIGSPGFMSPEQVRGERVTKASDVFALGSVLAYAATGRMPFGSSEIGLHAVMYRIAQDEPDLSELPEELVALVRDCLAKEPGERPAVKDIVERTRAADTSDASDTAWLPGGLLADLGSHALRLLDTDGPEPTVVDTPAPPPSAPAPPPPAPEPSASAPGPAVAADDAEGKPPKVRRRIAVLGAVSALLAVAVVFAVLRPGKGSGDDQQGAEGPTGRATTTGAASASGSSTPSSSSSASVSPSASLSPSSSVPGAAGAERMPESLVGAWEGKVKTDDGMARAPRVRIELKAGTRGQPLAVYTRLGYFSRCEARSPLRSVDGDSITLGEARWVDEQTVEGENREECGAPPSGQTVKLRSEGAVDWSGGGGSLELARAASGSAAVPEEYVGKWEFVDLENNRTGEFLTIAQGPAGGPLITVGGWAGCEYVQTLTTIDDGLGYGPAQLSLDDDSEGADACERGANGSSVIEPSADGGLLLWQMYDLGSEPGTLVRARSS
ncbi:serine/threonine-protein kinase [Streptomyces sp. NPDC050263]|uniref:serine/threonine-protein kinase n=1 Tax=Streptomyces sp. NPDC050263 TaxID=3155037 RepID=UPI0034177C21